MSRITTLLDSNVQCSIKISQGIQRNKYGSFEGKTKSTETVPEKYLITDLLDKDFKTTV